MTDLLQTAGIWRFNRQLYPGWVIAPLHIRKDVWSYTKNWLEEIVENSNGIALEKMIWVLYELDFRLSVSLKPLFSELAEQYRTTIEAVEKVSSFSKTVVSVPAQSGKSENLDISEELDDYWRTLEFSYLRYCREELDTAGFDQVAQAIRGKTLTADDEARLSYELALFALSCMNDARVRLAIESWSENVSDQIWLIRKAAILVELGEFEDGKRLALHACQVLREGNQRTITSLSRERWAMMLLRAIQRHEESAWTSSGSGRLVEPDHQGRWLTFAKYLCDPWAETRPIFDAAETISKKEDVPDRQVLFQPGHIRTKGFSITNVDPNVARLSPAYEMMRFCEEAAFVPRVGVIDMYKPSAIKSAEVLANEDPVRTESLMLRTHEPKIIGDFLTRHRIAAYDLSKLKGWFKNSTAALQDIANLRIAISKPVTPKKLRQQRIAKASIEILARVVIRLDGTDLSFAWDHWFELYQDAPVSFRFREELKQLLTSLVIASAFDNSILQTQFRRLVNSRVVPPLESDEPTIVFYREIGLKEFGEVGTANWSEVIESLLGKSEKTESRTSSLVRLAVLYQYGCLSAAQASGFAASYWRDHFVEGLPIIPPFRPIDCLLFPEPESDLSIARFREWCLEQPLDVSLADQWIKATKPLLDKSKIRRVEWSTENLEKMLEGIAAWWRNNQPQNLLFAIDEYAEISIAVQDVLRFVIIPRIQPNTELANKVTHFANELQIADVAYAIAPAMTKLCEWDAASELRKGITSQDRIACQSALLGILYWIENEQSELDLPPIPDDLLTELGVLVAARHQPHLDLALEIVRNCLRIKARTLTRHFLQSVNHSLHYLYTELKYSIRETQPARIPYCDVPKLRKIAVEIALSLEERGESDEIVSRWIDLATSDALPEIRRLVASRNSPAELSE